MVDKTLWIVTCLDCGYRMETFVEMTAVMSFLNHGKQTNHKGLDMDVKRVEE